MRSLAVNQFTTPKWSFEEDVQAYAAAGFQGIGVVRDKAQAYGVEAASALLKEDPSLARPEHQAARSAQGWC